MFEKTSGIVLQSIPYNDKMSIVHIYTERYGCVSYALPVGTGRQARQMRVLLQPLSILSLDVENRPGRDIQKIKEARVLVPTQRIYLDPVKNVVALFLAEVLSEVIREPDPNPALFAYLLQSIELLDMMEEGKANFHICFLLQLSGYLGFFPNTESYERGYCFDMLGGVFTGRHPAHPYVLEGDEALFFMQLMRMDFSNLHLFRFNRTERMQVLERILLYFRLHHPGVSELRSLEVLKAIFD